MNLQIVNEALTTLREKVVRELGRLCGPHRINEVVLLVSELRKVESAQIELNQEQDELLRSGEAQHGSN
jgi:hypothetical protein